MFARLWTASTSMHAADQITLAAAPLLAKTWGASTGEIGLIVAAQSAAWLLLSLPAGALADRYARRTLMLAAAACALAGALVALAALLTFAQPLLAMALACFLISAGIVIIILSVFAVLPGMVGLSGLQTANARLEFARAAVTIAMPLLVSWLIAHDYFAAIFIAVALAALLALIAVYTLPPEIRAQTPAPPIFASIRDGAHFVVLHPTLRAIALCAIFWNIAFFALIGLFVPFAASILNFGTQDIGRCWAFFGAGMLIAAWFSPAITARFSRRLILLFGPGVSMLSGIIFAVSTAATPAAWVWAGFFLLGFGPMLWAVTQITLRQMVTPPEMMGRVGATMQVTNYGVRPLGAMIAGWLAAQTSLAAAMVMPAILFALSFASMAMMAAAANKAAGRLAQPGDAQ